MTGVELLVLGWFASPVISRVVEKAHNLLSTNYELQKGTRGLVDTLKDTLALCQATVEEAEKRMINNSNLITWLKMLKEVVYDAEDVLDNMEAKSIKEKVQGKNKVSNFASSSLSGLKNMLLPDDNHKSLKKVVDKLKQLSANITTFVKLVSMNENNESHIREVTDDQRETISQPLEEVGLYGRQDELDLILEMILGSESESTKKKGQNYNNYHGLFVLPIVGMGGVGKTALAQAVYNDPGVQQAFQLKSWISVSCNLDVVLLMRKIIQSLGGYLRLDVITLEEISKNLSFIIGQVKFLVVLDNTSEKIESKWEIICKILSHGAPGSVVLITTQNQEFANKAATFGHVALGALEGDIFWKLFERFAFGDVVMSEDKRIFLEPIGKKIANKLRGLPLAAKIIGNVLRANLDEQRWRRISKSEWWDIPEGKSQILPSIGLGYEHLNPCLRQCFAYCSVFPRNSIIEKDRLVQMWIAQNFIPQGSRPEDDGSECFDKLVEKSFFQPTVDNKGYVVHDLMHDLAVIVSSNECFYLNNESVEIPQGVRHLAVDTKNLEVLKGIRKHKHLRSFFYFGFFNVEGMYSTINEALCNLDSIRVLDLSYLDMETEQPPAAIQNLTHLRFLDLSFTEIEVLSRSSFDHYHLQALHIKKCQLLQLPRGINKLINLRHLNGDAETIAQISGIGKLTNLQELNIYTVGKQVGHKISELKNLREITGHLKIDMCENIISKDEAMQANLFDKKCLDSIEICWSSVRRRSNIDMMILEGLQPPEHINELAIINYLGPSFPDWTMQMSHFENLQKVRLFACERTEMLPPLGQLPSLKYLLLEGLHSIKIIDHNFYGNHQTVFPVLRAFVFIGTCCQEWTAAQVGEFFPHLSSLDINGCYVLRQLPLHCFGSSLKHFKMQECHSFNSLERSLHYLSSLTSLHITHCRVSISLKFSCLMLLEELYLKDCPELSIEGDLQSLTNLKNLYITSCPNLLSMRLLKGKSLRVHQGEGLRSLTCIDMDFLNQDYHLILERLPSLKILTYRCWQFSQFTEYQTLWFQELITLEVLHFTDCEFEHLPSNLATLSSLKKVMLNSCTRLESLPENGMPPFLRELTLAGCSQNLVQRCQPNDGEDWHLISHVPLIRIGARIISKPRSSGETSG